MKGIIGGLLALVALAGGTPAQAAWRKAETQHFILYSEGPVPALTRMAQHLEKLDRLQRFLFGAPDQNDGLKIRVFVLRDEAAVVDSMTFGSQGVLGYYNAVTRGPFAVVPQSVSDGGDLQPENVLFHELTHHFQLQYFPATYPAWFTEGLAEFIGTAKIGDSDQVEIGDLPPGRYDMFRYDWVAAEKLVQAKGYGDVDNTLLLYSEGWLLTHYLLLSGKANGQLDTFLEAINAGTSFRDAGVKAFGDLRKLNVELLRYARLRRLSTRIITLPGSKDIDVAVTTVPAAEDALMEQSLRLYSGVKVADASKFAAQVRQIAAHYPHDPYALRTRIEADRWAGDWDDASDSAARWLAAAPNDPWAHFFQGLIATDRLAASKSTDAAAWQTARASMEQSKALLRDPQAARWLYESYRNQDVLPPVRLQNALFYAHKLVPQDSDLAYLVAADFEKRGYTQEAIDVISPLAFGSREENPKEKEKAERNREKYREAGSLRRETAREMLARLQEKLKSGGSATGSPEQKTAAKP